MPISGGTLARRLGCRADRDGFEFRVTRQPAAERRVSNRTVGFYNDNIAKYLFIKYLIGITLVAPPSTETVLWPKLP